MFLFALSRPFQHRKSNTAVEVPMVCFAFYTSTGSESVGQSSPFPATSLGAEEMEQEKNTFEKHWVTMHNE